MRHPFELKISDLEAVELDTVRELTDEETKQISGGGSNKLTTFAIGEEGGEVTTFAIGEEGGEVTTLAIGEEGGEVTTLAIGEEGGHEPVTTNALGEEGGSWLPPNKIY